MQRLKKHESGRSSAKGRKRNNNGKTAAARLKQLKKRNKLVVRNLRNG